MDAGGAAGASVACGTGASGARGGSGGGDNGAREVEHVWGGTPGDSSLISQGLSHNMKVGCMQRVENDFVGPLFHSHFSQT